MTGMFNGASAFNQPVSFDTSSVTYVREYISTLSASIDKSLIDFLQTLSSVGLDVL